ncbi:uncharacterized protein LOC110990915, partial [Acanthaster planci]|uniref:Uncharacterized protein LOC110990915 n=1 Tax=Acanthaster planci TaxID=133434 RepID=A0A8B8A1S3_ACAPL
MLWGPIQKKMWVNRDLYHIDSGILWRKIGDTNVLVVPQTLQGQIIEMNHDLPSAGHAGIDRTIARIKSKYYCCGMTEDIKKYVILCSVCNQNKKATRHPKCPMIEYHAGLPMEKVHLDFLGPLPKTPRGNEYILMMVDQFTKWVECIPLPSQTAEVTAQAAVSSFFSRFGYPLQIVTDQGRNFESKLFSNLCKVLQIHKAKTTPYRPSANGQVERYNRTLMDAVRCYVGKSQNQWDKHLDQIAGAVRSTVNCSTGFMPSMLMLGRETNQPVDLMFPFPPSAKTVGSIDEYCSDLAQAISSAHEAARTTLLVKGKCRKLSPPWKGPALITRKLSPYLYRVEYKNITFTVNHDHLKRCRDRKTPDKGKESGSPAKEAYSFCRKPDDGNFMIQCDGCDEWYHGQCVNVPPEDGMAMDNLSNRGERKDHSEKRMERKRKHSPITTAPKRRKQSCPIKGCDHTTNKLKWHVYYHLPEYYRISKTTERLQPTYQKLRVIGLVFLSKTLVGETVTVSDLVSYANRRWTDRGSTISAEVEAEMYTLSIQQGWPRVPEFTLGPINSPAALIHWRPLSFLFNQLNKAQQEEFRNLSINDADTPDPHHVQEIVLEGIDSHFHLDRLEDSLGREGLECIQETLDRRPDHTIVLSGGVINYYDPEHYHRILFSADSRWKVAVGVHPKKVSRMTEQQWDQLQQLLAHPQVIAISEVGLDFSISKNTWDRQTQFLEHLLNLGTLGFVLVVHLRGARGDPTGVQVQEMCRGILQQKCSRYQRIHLHSFTGNRQQMEAWLTVFPNCYLGFSALTKNFCLEQLEALRCAPLDRVLLETDSPHFRVHSTRVNTPAYLGDIGSLVANVKQIALAEVMQATT